MYRDLAWHESGALWLLFLAEQHLPHTAAAFPLLALLLLLLELSLGPM